MVDSAAQLLAQELVNRRESINRELSRNGVRFGIYKNGQYADRLFPYDPIPRIIESDDFDRLESGLKQRITALNAYLKDIYSDKNIVNDGVIPEEYVYTSAGYLPQVNGITPTGGIFAHIAGEDLVQGQDGRWWVLEDNLRIPSGASYPLFVRDIERRIYPKLFRDVHVRDNRGYAKMLRRSMDFVSTDGMAVILSPGRYNSAFFEHAYLAEKTGATLAFPEDLKVVDNKLFLMDYAGERHRVGVIYRRLADEFLDPFAFNPDSVIGVPGLLGVYRSGNVAIVNAPGNGAGDDKAIYYFVPDMIKYYLHEEPILHNAPTYLPLFDADRKQILDRIGELVIKDVAESGGYGVVFGSSLDRSHRDELAERIVAQPRRFIAQEVIQFRDIDVVDPATHELVPRKCDLRAFVVTGRQTDVWYSGLTRYSSIAGQMIVNSSQGGGFKDTWVLAGEDADDAQVPAEESVQGTGHPEEPDQDAHGTRNTQEQGEEHTKKGHSVGLVDDPASEAMSMVTASKADNLYWLGRYTERVYTTLNQFFPFYDRVMDSDVEAFRPFAKALDLPQDFDDFDAFITSFLYDDKNPNSVRSAVISAFRNAVILRPELSSRLLQYIEMALINMADAATRSPTAQDIYKQRDIDDDILALWGGIENADVDTSLKSFIFIGKYIERLDLYTRFGMPEQSLREPVVKLGSYIVPLDGLPLPPCFAGGLSWLVAQLPQRGYEALAKQLKTVLDDFSHRVISNDLKGLNMLNAMNMDSKRP